MQIHMQYVDAHVTGLGDTYQRVEICAVEINQASLRVNHRGYGLDVLLEESQGVRVSDHESGHILVHHFFNGRRVDDSPGAGRNLDHVVAAER